VHLAEPAVQVANAGEHMLALLKDGTVETWGSNLWGELGIGTDGGGREACTVNCRSTVPVQVPGLSGVVAVYAGGAFDAALLNDGSVLAWGENQSGQLGDGTTLEKDVPTLVRGLSGVRSLALGGEATLGGHSLALLQDGTLMAWGENRQGQLGDGAAVMSSTPVRVIGLSGVTALAASWTHNLAIAGGRLYAWGSDRMGEIGAKTTSTCMGLLMVRCALAPTAVPLEGVTSIATGFASSYAAAGGHAYSWGEGNYGELGNGSLVNAGKPGPVSGLSGVSGVAAGNIGGFALLSAPAPQPDVEVSPGPGVLTVRWQAPPGPQSWHLNWRDTGVDTPFGAKLELPPATRSYTITGLEPRRYEVAVQQTLSGQFGRRVLEGTPTP
jgi:alpha-tubulin suppressor-like RCC1 family protein